MALDLLLGPNQPKIVRTRLYEDQEFSRFELDLLHTPLFQRLYQLRQLGFADKVYPDATHTRFNHILGVPLIAERLARRLIQWLKMQDCQFHYWTGAGETAISSPDLAEHIVSVLPGLRLAALLHDLTHSAFGHTLEDELQAFEEKHDSPARQARFFDALTEQLFSLWAMELNALHFSDVKNIERLLRHEAEADAVIERAEAVFGLLKTEQRDQLLQLLSQLEFAMSLLLHLDASHQTGLDGHEKPTADLLLASVLERNGKDRISVTPARDLVLIDIIGNTICADLLDYVRRDADQSGLKADFDDRIIRYVAAVSVSGYLSPNGKRCVRAAIQFFTNKMRHDVLSELSGILKARYLIHERIINHPTKSAAGAMLGSAVLLLGVRNLPPWVLGMGDQEFLNLLLRLSRDLLTLSSEAIGGKHDRWRTLVRRRWAREPDYRELISACIAAMSGDAESVNLGEVRERATAALAVLWRLSSRRFPKLVYRIRRDDLIESEYRALAQAYSLPNRRYDLEREIERACALPKGTIFIHCPRELPGFKAARVLMVGDDLKDVRQLRDVGEFNDRLKPYQDEIRSVERMYDSIWSMHIFLDSSHFEYRELVAWQVNHILSTKCDRLLVDELRELPSREEFRLLCEELSDAVAPDHRAEVIAKLATARSRSEERSAEGRVLAAVREVAFDRAERDARVASRQDV